MVSRVRDDADDASVSAEHDRPRPRDDRDRRDGQDDRVPRPGVGPDRVDHLEVEEGHAHALALRIRALERQPTPAEPAAAPARAEPTADPAVIADMLRLDLADEQWAITYYATTIAEFLPDGDDETLAVLEENLLDELRHARWLRDRLRLLI